MNTNPAQENDIARSSNTGPGHDIIVVGASAGGLDVLQCLAARLPADLPAAVFVVQHTSPRAPGLLGDILSAAGPLSAGLARDGETFRKGRIYVAPPDYHLLLTADGIRLSHSPRENRARPAIDPLFRTAAVAFRSRVIGVILSGMQDDGTAGLLAVTRCGGLSVVQDPADAAYPEMPRNALQAVAADHVVPADQVGTLLGRLAAMPAGDAPPVPRNLLIEAQITMSGASEMKKLDRIGERTQFTCPDCGGVIWKLHDPKQKRYRCHVGHAYTEQVMVDEQAESVERALLVALRTMEERIRLLQKLGQDPRSNYAEQADELERHAEQIRNLFLQARGPGSSHEARGEREPSLAANR